MHLCGQHDEVWGFQALCDLLTGFVMISEVAASAHRGTTVYFSGVVLSPGRREHRYTGRNEK